MTKAAYYPHYSGKATASMGEGSAGSQNNMMLWAACTMCFFGFLRSGEIVAPTAYNFDPSYHLTIKDITIDSPVLPS